VDVAGIIDLADEETAYVAAKAYPASGAGSDLAKGTVTYVDPSSSPHDPPSAPTLVTLAVTGSEVDVL